MLSFYGKDKDNTEHERMAHLGFSAAEQAVSSGEYDIVVLDEINQAIYQEFLISRGCSGFIG